MIGPLGARKFFAPKNRPVTSAGAASTTPIR